MIGSITARMQDCMGCNLDIYNNWVPLALKGSIGLPSPRICDMICGTLNATVEVSKWAILGEKGFIKADFTVSQDHLTLFNRIGPLKLGYVLEKAKDNSSLDVASVVNMCVIGILICIAFGLHREIQRNQE